jgi:hypothetical protein
MRSRDRCYPSGKPPAALTPAEISNAISKLNLTGTANNIEVASRVTHCDVGEQDPLLNRVWAWFNPRISSLPQSSALPISNLNNPATLLGLSTGNVNNLVQSLDFLGGVDIAIIRPTYSFAGNEKLPTRTGVYFTMSAGASTPLIHDDTVPVAFALNPTLTDAYHITDPNLKFISFIPQDRSRFYIQYYAGMRVKTYYFGRDSAGKEAMLNRFPGQFDFLIGQNEAITGAGLKGPVARVEGFYPLPFVPSLHLFGTMMLRLTGRGNEPGIVLGTPQDPKLKSPFDADVFRVNALPLQPRDYFRIGIGFDLLTLLKNYTKSSATNNTNGAKP